jgi:hypothetical protein
MYMGNRTIYTAEPTKWSAPGSRPIISAGGCHKLVINGSCFRGNFDALACIAAEASS